MLSVWSPLHATTAKIAQETTNYAATIKTVQEIKDAKTTDAKGSSLLTQNPIVVISVFLLKSVFLVNAFLMIIRLKDAIQIMIVDLQKFARLRNVFLKYNIVILGVQQGPNVLTGNVSLISKSVLKIPDTKLLYAPHPGQTKSNAHNSSISLHLTWMFVE